MRNVTGDFAAVEAVSLSLSLGNVVEPGFTGFVMGRESVMGESQVERVSDKTTGSTGYRPSWAFGNRNAKSDWNN